MLMKALIAALAAIALAVVAPAAGAATAKPRPVTASTPAAHAATPACATIKRPGGGSGRRASIPTRIRPRERPGR